MSDQKTEQPKVPQSWQQLIPYILAGVLGLGGGAIGQSQVQLTESKVEVICQRTVEKHLSKPNPRVEVIKERLENLRKEIQKLNTTLKELGTSVDKNSNWMRTLMIERSQRRTRRRR